MLNGSLDGGMEDWTLPIEQWALVRDVILRALEDADRERGVPLASVVAMVQVRLEDHPAFPGRRLTNFTRYVKVDLEARGLLEVVPRSSPQRIRSPAQLEPGGVPSTPDMSEER